MSKLEKLLARRKHLMSELVTVRLGIADELHTIHRDNLNAFLTIREEEVLALVNQDMSNKEIGDMLHISANTVRFHMASLLLKYGVRTRRDL